VAASARSTIGHDSGAEDEANMRRVVIGAVLAATAVLVVRALGPKLRRRCEAERGRMFERMPDDFPPKRMLRGIEAIHEQNARILHLLGEREVNRADTAG
jgi:hypothetical protein